MQNNQGAVANFMTCLENLDFADNDLGNAGCKQVAKMLMETPSIKKLDISHNNIGMEGLELICLALTDP
jgi:Ran GTPase-activating protein (RanGAP) involved in mRNA processing and transport